MKHLLSILSILALAFVAFGDVGHATQIDPPSAPAWHGTDVAPSLDLAGAAVVFENIGAREFAYLPITKMPARIELARQPIPIPARLSGYQIQAWKTSARIDRHTVSLNSLGLIWRGPRNYDRLN